MLIVGDNEGSSEIGEKEEDDKLEKEQARIKLSVNVIEGLHEPKTLKLPGNVAGHPTMVFINYGTNYNFNSTNLIQRASLRVIETKEYRVLISNGGRHKRSDVCRMVTLRVGHFQLTDDFLPIKMGSFDMILGIKVFYDVGETPADWKKLIMSFKIEDEEIVLREDPALSKSRVSLKTM